MSRSSVRIKTIFGLRGSASKDGGVSTMAKAIRPIAFKKIRGTFITSHSFHCYGQIISILIAFSF
jgi:hypothetical protein